MKKHRFAAGLTALALGLGMTLTAPLQPVQAETMTVQTFFPEQVQSSDYWFTAACSYMYDRMDQDSKALYDALYAACKEVDNSDADNIYGSVSVKGPMNLSQSAKEDTVHLFLNDHTEFFWLDGSYSVSGVGVSLTILSDFANGANRRAAKTRVSAAVSQFLDGISSSDTEYNRARAILDVMQDKIITRSDNYDNSVYSPLIMNRAVASGYAKLYSLLCNAVGVNCLCMNGGGNYWNAVRISGNWYYVDVKNGMFLLSKSEIETQLPGNVYTADAGYYSANYPEMNSSYGGSSIVTPPETTTTEESTTTTEESTTTTEESTTTTEESTTTTEESTTEESTTTTEESTTEESTTTTEESTTEESTTATEESTTEESTTATEESTTEESTTMTEESTTMTEESSATTETMPSDVVYVVTESYRTEGRTVRYYADDQSSFQPWSLIQNFYKDIHYSDGSVRTEQIWDFNPIRFENYAVNPKEFYEKYVNAGYYHGGIYADYYGTRIEIGDVWIGVKGDADLNGKMNASDAAAVLIYAAEVGAGQSDYSIHNDRAKDEFSAYLSCFNGEQKLGADVAARILIRAAEIGAGNQS